MKRVMKIIWNMVLVGEEVIIGSVVKILCDELFINEYVFYDYIVGVVGGIVDVMLM